jgi:intein/homing endonuclease
MEFTLSELNTLHYAMSKAVIAAREEYKQFGGDPTSEFGINYFERNLKATEELQTKIADALYARVKEIEKIEEEIREKRTMKKKGFMTTEELDALAQAEIDMVNRWG